MGIERKALKCSYVETCQQQTKKRGWRCCNQLSYCLSLSLSLSAFHASLTFSCFRYYQGFTTKVSSLLVFSIVFKRLSLPSTFLCLEVTLEGSWTIFGDCNFKRNATRTQVIVKLVSQDCILLYDLYYIRHLKRFSLSGKLRKVLITLEAILSCSQELTTEPDFKEPNWLCCFLSESWDSSRAIT